MRAPTESLLDGQKQLETYASTLTNSKEYFTALLASSGSKSWKPLALPAAPTPAVASSSSASSTAPSAKGKETASSVGSSSAPNVVVHRKTVKGGEVFRATVEVASPAGGAPWDVDGFRALLATAEARSGWDRMVEGATTVELIDEDTRIVRTKYRLGWPSSPRDTITISQTSSDAETVINIATSLPRSADEPAYLRPSPPYVRAHVSLLAFCIQLPSASSTPAPPAVSNGHAPPRDPVASTSTAVGPSGPSTPSDPATNRLRITCFWQWDPKGSWAVGSGIGIHIPALLSGLVEHAREYSDKIPLLSSFGSAVSLSSTSFDTGRDTLNLDYSVVYEDSEDSIGRERPAGQAEGELERVLDFALPASQGWRIQVTVKSLVREDEIAPRWIAALGRRASSSPATLQPPSASSSPSPPARLVLRISHPVPLDRNQLLRIHLAISRDTSTRATRVNGIIQPIVDLDPSSSASASSATATGGKRLADQLLLDKGRAADTASLSGFSTRTIDTVSSVASSSDGNRRPQGQGPSGDVATETKLAGDRSEKAERSVLSLIRRNYIYFTSLLQEPEAKWKPVLEAGRGVSIHQLDSIDRTLVVYRAEAVFVGVGIWDLLAVISSPGARLAWDKAHEDAILLDDVNELSEVWWWKTRAAWPVAARDSVQLKTTYKSPTSVHVFSFSTDDHGLFPSIPPVDPIIIRTQIDLQGWSIEALSPNTTQVTLVEQSDPKGWTNKSSIPQIMANTLAGIGEFAIRSGGPPLMTRLGHAKVLNSRYDLEKGTYRLEYQPAEWRRASLASGVTSLPSSSNAIVPSPFDETSFVSSSRTAESENGPVPNVECELRCDSDTWASSLDIVIDPPPQSVSCLRRHRLSSGGGGSWITIEHDAVLLNEDKVLVIIRKGPPTSKDKNLVIVNGKKIKVDLEDLPEAEVKNLSKQKRIKPTRIPLDQPPVLGATRRRHAIDEPLATPATSRPPTPDGSVASNPMGAIFAGATRFASPLSRLWYTADASSSTDVSVVTPPPEPISTPPPPATTLKPMQIALDALDSTRLLHSQGRDPGSWALVIDTGGFVIEKRNVPSVSTAFPVHRASRVIQGSTPEDVLGAVTTAGCRKHWDERFESAVQLESYGNGCTSSFLQARCTFPFRDRGFLVSSVTAKGVESPPTTPTLNAPASSSSSLFHVSASYPREAAVGFDGGKINPFVLPIGQQLLEGWVMETLDPYGNEQYPIPSTRCTYYSAVDYSGSIPTVVNSSINASLPRVLLGVEAYLKARKCAPLLRNPSSGIVFDPRRDDLTSPSSSAVDLKVWELNGIDGERMALQSSFDPVEAEFKSSLFVRPQSWIDVEDLSSSRTPLPGSWQPSAPDARARTVSSSAATLKPTEAQKKTSSSSLREDAEMDKDLLSPSSSMSDLRSRRSLRQSPSASSSLSRASSATVMDLSEVRKSRRGKDFLVAEYVVDTTAFPAGYNVTSSASVATSVTPLLPPPSVPLPSEPGSSTNPNLAAHPHTSAPAPPLPLKPLTSREHRLDLPLKITVLPLPAPPIHAASLSSAPPRKKHLIRITLPTAQFQPPVQDPLHEEPQTAPKRPAWLDAVEDKGAIVHFAIDALAGEAYDEPDMMIVTVEGAVVEVGKRERSSSMASLIGRAADSLDEEWSGAWPKLRRTLLPPGAPGVSAPAPPISPLPASLTYPVAIAHHLFHDPAPPPPPTDKGTSSTGAPAEGEIAAVPAESTGKSLEDVKSDPTPTRSNSLVATITASPNPGLSPTPALLSFFSLRRPTLSFPTSISNSHPSTPLPSPLPLPASNFFTFTRQPRFLLSASAPNFSLATLILVALVSFLLGSLIRSLLSPADFVVFVGEEGAVEEGWREVVRLAEWRGVWKGGDLMIGWVRRG